jgi:hypothetical protein
MNFLLFRTGWVLIGLALVILLFTIIPFSPFDPQWQLRFTASILAYGFLVLVGSTFVSYASRRDELDRTSLGQAKFLRTMLAWIGIATVLLVPVQITAAIGIVRSNYFNGLTTIRLVGNLVDKIKSTNNEQELRELMAKLPDSPELPSRIEVPFPEFKNSVAAVFDSKRIAVKAQLSKVRDATMQDAIKDSIRNGASLILLAFGFMSVSISDPSQRTVVTSIVFLIEKQKATGLWFNRSRRQRQTPTHWEPQPQDDE